MTAPLLNTICNSSPCSRMASRTRLSFGSQVATMDRPTESGVTPFLRRLFTNSGEERRFLFCGRVKEQRSILRNDAVEKIDPRKDAHEIRQFAASDEKKLPAGSPEGDERLCGCVLDHSVMREGAIIVGRETADVHGTPCHDPHEFWLERSKDRHSSGFSGKGAP